MKDVYLVHITLPDVFTPAFYRLIPAQRTLINKLLEKRTILSYSLDMERKNVWAYIEAVSEQEVMDILSTFPIIKEVRVNIHELAFF
ncbi:MAG: hypothetical protein K0S12_296, partial [Bacteroidetes bacterium]|nr:hypothetical protein [Bacteroidota bacterium]